MLDFYHRLARRLYRYRMVFWVVCGIAVAGFAGALLFPGAVDDQTLSLAALVLLVWAICVLTLSYSFVAPPPVAGPGSGWWRRMMTRVRRAFLWLMAVAMTLLTLLVIGLSFRVALFLWRDLG